MTAGPTRKARRLALHSPPEPVELTPDDLATLRRLARKVARRMADHRTIDEDDLYQEGALAATRVRRAAPEASPRLVHHAARDEMRRLAFGRRLSWEASEAAAVEKAEAAAKRPALQDYEVADLHMAVSSLPPEVAEVMGRRLRCDEARQDIMAATGRSRDWVGDRIRIGMARLRVVLADYEPEFGRSVPLRDPGRYRARRQSYPCKPSSRDRNKSRATRTARKLAVIEAAHARLA